MIDLSIPFPVERFDFMEALSRTLDIDIDIAKYKS
jgi:hypothetical protein